MIRTTTSIVTLLAMTAAASADVRLPAVISDHMVLKQNSIVPMWGWADPGETVEVTASWSDDLTETAVADEDGRWDIELETTDAGGPHAITFVGNNRIELTDVLMGEVWVCSGQSNMEWPMTRTMNGEAEIAAANDPMIRLFDVRNEISLVPKDDCTGSWSACTPDTVRGFSAVGYFFARSIREHMDVPIGLIGSNWGGTPAESWTSEPTLRKRGDFDAVLDQIAAEHASQESGNAAFEEAMAAWNAEFEANDVGLREGWMAMDYDHTGWPSMRQPQEWGATDLERFDGVAWFRHAFAMPSGWAGKDLVLSLGPIDDMDVTYVNGQEVGRTWEPGKHAQPRQYTIPADVMQKGLNVLVIRMYDPHGGGGMTGQDADAWVAPEGTAPEDRISLAGTYRYYVALDQFSLPPKPVRSQSNARTATVLYNGMIAPIQPYGISGAIWYQGESNRGRYEQYRTLFPDMIEDWRRTWMQGDFPFYFVQIAPFNYGGDTGQAAMLREAQTMTMSLPNTGMAVTMDIGNPADIHPANKQEVGRRLALWALAHDYGADALVYSGPLYADFVREGDAMRLSFTHVAEGLQSDGALTHFTICGEDRVFHPATAVIDGDTVVVRSDAVGKPIAVRYGWGTADEPNLKNSAGLPAPSFRTDDFEE